VPPKEVGKTLPAVAIQFEEASAHAGQFSGTGCRVTNDLRDASDRLLGVRQAQGEPGTSADRKGLVRTQQKTAL
jgi:hypothetical protein